MRDRIGRLTLAEAGKMDPVDGAPKPPGGLERGALIAVRYGLPGALLVAGAVLILIDAGDAMAGLGVGLALAALVVFLLNVFMRAGITSQRDRDREQAAREHFDRHGRWPE